MAIDDGFFSLMDPETCDQKDDLRVPDNEIGQQIRDAFEKEEGSVLVQVVSAIGEEAALGWKVSTKE